MKQIEKIPTNKVEDKSKSAVGPFDLNTFKAKYQNSRNEDKTYSKVFGKVDVGTMSGMSQESSEGNEVNMGKSSSHVNLFDACSKLENKKFAAKRSSHNPNRITVRNSPETRNRSQNQSKSEKPFKRTLMKNRQKQHDTFVNQFFHVQKPVFHQRSHKYKMSSLLSSNYMDTGSYKLANQMNANEDNSKPGEDAKPKLAEKNKDINEADEV